MVTLSDCRAFMYATGISIAAMFVMTKALAVPIDYSEAASGDLTFPAPAFVLDAGRNTIAGTTHFNFNSPGGPRFDTDFDSFAFVVPTGLQLVGISLSFATTAFNVAGADLELRLCRDVNGCGLDPTELLGADVADLLGVSPQALAFGLQSPIAAGLYSLLISGIGIGVADGSIPQAAWSTDYAWALQVERVTEPGVLYLLVVGLACLIYIRPGRWRTS